MKKVTVLSVMAVTIGLGLFVVFSNCYAQGVGASKYVKDNSTGIEILLPQGLNGYGSYFTNDTLNVRAGTDVIREYQGKIYLNKKYIGYVIPGDTVIYTQGSLFKKASLTLRNQKPTFISNGIIYFTPYYLNTVISTKEGDVYPVGDFTIREHQNKIYLNGVYQGDAFANDTVILRKNGTLSVKNDLGLFVIGKTQKTSVGYAMMGSRGIVYLYPSELVTRSIDNGKDTADYQLGKYFIQEYKRNLYLDGKFVERVEEGDTVILNKGSLSEKAFLTIKKSSYPMRSLSGSNIIYLFPKGFSFTCSNIKEGTNYTIDQSKIKEFENKIYLNDVYQGEAFANDTVILRRNGTLTIKNAKRE